MRFSLEKDYYKIGELREKFGITLADLEYLIHTKNVPVYVFISDAVIECGSYTLSQKGRMLHKFQEALEFSGLIKLRSEDVDEILRNGTYKVSEFEPHEGHHYKRLGKYKKAITIKLSDLSFKSQDCIDLELVPYMESIARKHKKLRKFTFENDFKMVKYGDEVFHFGETQASVISHLYKLVQTDNPWIHGKQLLHSAGSSSMRMHDVFKSQKKWKRIIEGNGKGYYRLKPAISDSIEHYAS